MSHRLRPASLRNALRFVSLMLRIAEEPAVELTCTTRPPFRRIGKNELQTLSVPKKLVPSVVLATSSLNMEPFHAIEAADRQHLDSNKKTQDRYDKQKPEAYRC